MADHLFDSNGIGIATACICIVNSSQAPYIFLAFGHLKARSKSKQDAALN